jgi:putative copper export protein
MAVLVLLNNFLHDFSAAGWLFSAVVLWSVLRKMDPKDRARRNMDHILKVVLLLMRFSLAGIIVFGLFRALAYKKYEWSAAAGEGQITLLIVKHILLAGVFVAGLVLYIRARTILRKTQNEKSG